MLFSFVLPVVAFAASVNSQGNGVHVPGSIPTNPYEPLQHRLAYAGPTGMTVSWNTYHFLANPMVSFGETPALGQTKVVSGQQYSVTYPTSRTFNNHVRLTGLKPNTKYWYKVSDTNCQGCAYLPKYTFTTSRAAGDMTPFVAAIVVDMGTMGPEGLSNKVGTGAENPLGANDTNTIQSLLENIDSYEFLGHWGDIAYADYFVKESYQGYFGANNTIPTSKAEIADKYEEILESFYDQMQPITARKPYMVAPGNHESNCVNGGTTDKVNHIAYDISNCTIGQLNFTGYKTHWRMPSPESKGVGNFWYSYDHGMAHFVVLDTETDLGSGIIAPDEPGGSEGMNSGPFARANAQLKFLKADLAAVDRTKTPWVIVGLHRPFYISSPGDEDLLSKSAFEQIFYDNNVDLYMSGHVHSYQRNNPLFNGTSDPKLLNNPRAPWNIVNGAAGHYDGLDPLVAANANVAKQFDDAYGWSRLTFHNQTHLTHEFVSSANGSVLDTATLYKAHNFTTKNGKGVGAGESGGLGLGVKAKIARDL